MLEVEKEAPNIHNYFSSDLKKPKTNSVSLFDYLIEWLDLFFMCLFYLSFFCCEILLIITSTRLNGKQYWVALYCTSSVCNRYNYSLKKCCTSSSLSRASWSLRWRSRASSQTCCHREQSWLRRGFPPVTCMAGCCCCCCCLPEEEKANISSNNLYSHHTNIQQHAARTLCFVYACECKQYRSIRKATYGHPVSQQDC